MTHPRAGEAERCSKPPCSSSPPTDRKTRSDWSPAGFCSQAARGAPPPAQPGPISAQALWGYPAGLCSPAQCPPVPVTLLLPKQAEDQGARDILLYVLQIQEGISANFVP